MISASIIYTPSLLDILGVLGVLLETCALLATPMTIVEFMNEVRRKEDDY
jgi:hypothetical protein